MTDRPDGGPVSYRKWVAMADRYPTEEAARLAFTPPPDLPYLGVWRLPAIGPPFHLWSDASADWLASSGYRLEVAPEGPENRPSRLPGHYLGADGWEHCPDEYVELVERERVEGDPATTVGVLATRCPHFADPLRYTFPDGSGLAGR